MREQETYRYAMRIPVRVSRTALSAFMQYRNARDVNADNRKIYFVS